MANKDAIQSLVELGFTALEAEVYAFLLTEAAVTGYRVAQALGKPAANIYKAIESLERKGAVIVDVGENRFCRAVPAEEVLNRLERRFRDNREKAHEALSELGEAIGDERLYQLRSRDQVFQRARAMLARCRHTAVMDIFPALVNELRQEIEDAAGRGVEVIVKTYDAVKLQNVLVVVRPRGHEVTDALPGDTISLNIDGVEHLLALVRSDADEVFQAIWTESAMVSYLLYNGLVNEVSQVAVMRELEGDTSVDRLRRTFNGLRHLHPTSSKGPAYQNLMRRLGLPVAEELRSKDAIVKVVESGDK